MIHHQQNVASWMWSSICMYTVIADIPVYVMPNIEVHAFNVTTCHSSQHVYYWPISLHQYLSKIQVIL